MNIANSTTPRPAKAAKAKVKAPQKRSDLLAFDAAAAAFPEACVVEERPDRATPPQGQQGTAPPAEPVGDDGAVLLQRASRSKKHSIGSFSRLDEDLEKVPERRGMIIDLLV